MSHTAPHSPWDSHRAHLYFPVSSLQQRHGQLHGLLEDGVRGIRGDHLDEHGERSVVEEALHLLQLHLQTAQAHGQHIGVGEGRLLPVHQLGAGQDGGRPVDFALEFSVKKSGRLLQHIGKPGKSPQRPVSPFGNYIN